MKPAPTDVAQALQAASSYAFHELEALLVCAHSTVAPLIDDVAAATTMDQAAIHRLLDVLLVLDTAFDVIRERLDERREAVEMVYHGRIQPNEVAFIVRTPRSLRGRRS